MACNAKSSFTYHSDQQNTDLYALPVTLQLMIPALISISQSHFGALFPRPSFSMPFFVSLPFGFASVRWFKWSGHAKLVTNLSAMTM